MALRRGAFDDRAATIALNRPGGTSTVLFAPSSQFVQFFTHSPVLFFKRFTGVAVSPGRRALRILDDFVRVEVDAREHAGFAVGPMFVAVAIEIWDLVDPIVLLAKPSRTEPCLLPFAQVVNVGRPTGARPRASPRWTHRRTTSASINSGRRAIAFRANGRNPRRDRGPCLPRPSEGPRLPPKPAES